MCPSKKLDWKQLGPFKVLKRIGLQSYKLDLPSTMHYIYNVFHVSLLEPYKSSSLPPHSLPLPLPLAYVKDDHEYFEVEDVLDSRRIGNRIQYLIKWKGYPHSDNSWEPLSHISAHGLIKEFHRRHPDKPGSHPQIRNTSTIR